jgi:hypothetical protein
MDHDMVDRVPPYCRVCNGVEGSSLPTDCPGSPLTKAQVGGIYRGDIDFRGGDWVDLHPAPVPEPLPDPPPNNTVHATVEVELPQPDPPPPSTTIDPVIIPVPVPVPVPVPMPPSSGGTENPQVIVNSNIDPNLDVIVTTK